MFLFAVGNTRFSIIFMQDFYEKFGSAFIVPFFFGNLKMSIVRTGMVVNTEPVPQSYRFLIY